MHFTPPPLLTKIASPFIFGLADFGLVKFAIYNGVKFTTEPLMVSAYILRRVISKILHLSSDVLKNFAISCPSSFSAAKKRVFYAMTIISWPLKKIDRVYSKVTGSRYYSTCEKIPSFNLTVSEIARKIFYQQCVDTLTCRISKKSAEFILKTTIVTLLPCSWKIHSIQFVFGLTIKSLFFYRLAKKEQVLYTEQLFVDMQNMIKEHYSALRKFNQASEITNPKFEEQLTYLYYDAFEQADLLSIDLENIVLDEAQRSRLFTHILAEFQEKVAEVNKQWPGLRNKHYLSLIAQQNDFIYMYRGLSKKFS